MQPPLSHLDDLVGHMRWLQEPGDPADRLAAVPSIKVRHFAAAARSLHAAAFRTSAHPNTTSRCRA